ncbi:MAG: PQQ-binding-like beta-propeller repeat protein [Fimbriimonadaceae bacterium]|nr:PQQ-binding-like beta-propeller repeat protein [Fimbriimonadaceae bacterium]
MRSSRRFLLWISCVIVASLMTAALGQDFPALKGNASRTGENGAPLTSGPGRGFLRWWRPNTGADFAIINRVIDNMDAAAAAISGGWAQPATLADEAQNSLVPAPYDTIPGAAPYRLAASEPALSNASNIVPQNAGNHAVWQWTVDPGDGIARAYSLHAWLPIGPTYVGGIPFYPQRYFTYEIIYANGLTYIDTVDTYQAGTGWVQLGNGGRPTTIQFAYDGINPIRIRLHNIIPRDQFGNLTSPPADSVVYADAVLAVPAVGTYQASPIVSQFTPPGGGPNVIHTVDAMNRYESTVETDGSITSRLVGVVRSLLHDIANAGQLNNTRWEYNPAIESEQAIQTDNVAASFIGIGWAVTAAPAGFRGVDYLRTAATDLSLGSPALTTVEYSPNVNDGVYDVYVWTFGSGSGTFGRTVRYEIWENGILAETPILDQDNQAGWIRIGTRRFSHTAANPMRVVVTNEVGALDLGRDVYADAIRVVGPTNSAITSTPIHAVARVRLSPGGPLVARPVVVAAAENGRIYCLDAEGDVTRRETNVLWTYPSTPDNDNAGWTDPNAVAGEDGGVAEMPTGFNLSSSIIADVAGEDVLYLCGTNGRIYAINMSGRGDMDFTLRKPGTTTRRWTYPDDYPAPRKSSNLGPFIGSPLVIPVAGVPTVIVPSTQGRLYALDADGTANKRTTVTWAFPQLNQPTIGAISSTPAFMNGNLYFGTEALGDRGTFYCLNSSGTPQWTFDNTTLWDPLGVTPVLADSFISGPAVADAATMGLGMPNMVFVANENGWISGLNADTGAIRWTTNELGSNVLANLSFTQMTVYTPGGILNPRRVVIVPTADGRITALYARDDEFNSFGGGGPLSPRLVWGYDTDSRFEASASVGRNFMYIGDTGGVLYAFADNAPFGTSIGNPPGRPQIAPDDPAGQVYRNAKIRFVNKTLYEAYRNGTATYAQLTNAANWVNGTAFEWGETIYVMAYDFPGNESAQPGREAQIEFRFSAEGAAFRNVTLRAKLAASSPPDRDGYAIYQFPIQGSGSNAMPPGNGQVSIGMNAWIPNGNPPPNDATLSNVTLDPATSRRTFQVANPIALVMAQIGGLPDLNRSLGYTIDPNDAEALMNGSQPINATPKLEERMLASMGLVPHNQTGNYIVGVVDRSLMTLLRRPGQGLDNVRVERYDLAWQGGAGAVIKPLNQLRYPLFEEMPVNFPNNSLDYSNIGRQNLFVTKDKFANAENPLITGVGLLPPTITDPSDPRNNRTLNITPFDLDLNVPRFQSANLSTTIDSAGASNPGGYLTGALVYVDSDGNSQFTGRGRREAYRRFLISVGIPVDERITVTTPNVDLSSLVPGNGYTPRQPWDPASIFSPWGGIYQPMFRPFNTLNEGNVNLLDLRIAKATNVGGARDPWQLMAPANHERSWLDGDIHLWSDIDSRFAPVFGGSNAVGLQKARVGDRVGTALSANPEQRPNANLGAPGGPLLNTAAFPPGPPRIAVSIPIGTPVGTYVTTMHVIEDPNLDESLAMDVSGRALEIYSDPTFTLTFKVREARLTNDSTRIYQTGNERNGPFIDNQLSGAENFISSNAQPAAMRSGSGRLSVVWASNRPNFTTNIFASTPNQDNWRLYFATMNGVAPTTGPNPSNPGNSPLNDLNSFSPINVNTRWFSQDGAAYPPAASDAGLFNVQPGETLIPETVRYGSPSYPVLGSFDPFGGPARRATYIVFVGEAQKQTSQGRISDSRVFIANVTMTPNGNPVGVSNPIGLDYNPEMRKFRPTVIQVGSTATVFFSGEGPGQQSFFYATFDGTNWGPVRQAQVGNGFEQIGSVSSSARIYSGASVPGLGSGSGIIELTFSGKLKGRNLTEAFYGRMVAGRSGAPAGNGAFVNLPARTTERLIPDGEPGAYRSLGIQWNTGATTQLFQTFNGATTNIEVAGTRTTDPATGLISFTSTLGGKVYLDPALGKVRFSGTSPNRNAIIMLSYTPRLLRVSTAQNVAYTNPSGLFDNRLIGEFDYWAQPGNTGITPNQQVRSGRYLFSFTRAASGNGQATRPFMRTMRLGVELPLPVHTQPNGTVTSINVAGNTSFYQIDPANGRIYFTTDDENRTVTITYTGLDATTGTPIPGIQVQAPVTMIEERGEAPVPLDQAVNESQMTTFIDPFDFPNAANRRAGLVWMFWTSTRGGTPDLFFQTIAPKFAPKAAGQ